MAEAEITPCQSITMSDKKPGAINYLSALPGNNYKEEPTAEGKGRAQSTWDKNDSWKIIRRMSNPFAQKIRCRPHNRRLSHSGVIVFFVR